MGKLSLNRYVFEEQYFYHLNIKMYDNWLYHNLFDSSIFFHVSVNMQAAFTFSYGWEWLTCENGFLMIFLCSPPFISILSKKYKKGYPPNELVIYLIRFLAFRLLLGAGMSKIGRNSSDCWRELTCTTTHYETQPIPNPLR